jgi:hypothetical protein
MTILTAHVSRFVPSRSAFPPNLAPRPRVRGRESPRRRLREARRAGRQSRSAILPHGPPRDRYRRERRTATPRAAGGGSDSRPPWCNGSTYRRSLIPCPFLARKGRRRTVPASGASRPGSTPGGGPRGPIGQGYRPLIEAALSTSLSANVFWSAVRMGACDSVGWAESSRPTEPG